MNTEGLEDSLRHNLDPLSVDPSVTGPHGQGNEETARVPCDDSFDDCGSLFGNREEQLALERYLYYRDRF